MEIQSRAWVAAGAAALVFAPAAIGVTVANGASEQKLSAEQVRTLERLGSPKVVESRGVPKGAFTAQALTPRSLSLYRGSWLMWARDTANWSARPGQNKVVSSSVRQEAGFIFPNVSRAKGASRYHTGRALHSWSGKYTIGAGVVTPWGDVKVYAADYSTDWQLRGDGSGRGRWNG